MEYLDSILPSEHAALQLTKFGGIMIYIYLGDRSALFMKAHKVFNSTHFWGMMFLAGVAGFLSLRTGADSIFLNRDQTDEWKGWMQIVILIYHYVGASKVSMIYNLVRVMVSSYLFMTGFGHFTYFYKKADFGIVRLSKVLLRLNILPVALAFIMDAPYLSYYFSPLVSFWFLVIYTSMGIMSSHNQRSVVLLCKMILALVVTSVIIHGPLLLETVFAWLERFFGIVWDAREWRFRLALDEYIVYVGMAIAYYVIHFVASPQSTSPFEGFKWVLVSIIGMISFLWWAHTCPEKYFYNLLHPYVSLFPVSLFVILRNSTETLRRKTSGFFCWIGRFSLETFLVQFHVWLAMDTRGILVIFPNYFWINVIFTTILFLYVCEILSDVTNQLVEWMVVSDSRRMIKRALGGIVGLILWNNAF